MIDIQANPDIDVTILSDFDDEKKNQSDFINQVDSFLSSWFVDFIDAILWLSGCIRNSFLVVRIFLFINCYFYYNPKLLLMMYIILTSELCPHFYISVLFQLRQVKIQTHRTCQNQRCIGNLHVFHPRSFADTCIPYPLLRSHHPNISICRRYTSESGVFLEVDRSKESLSSHNFMN